MKAIKTFFLFLVFLSVSFCLFNDGHKDIFFFFFSLVFLSFSFCLFNEIHKDITDTIECNVDAEVFVLSR